MPISCPGRVPVPTLVTDSVDALEHKCRVLNEALQDRALARHIPGIHLEGPHISPQDGPRGRTPPRTSFLPT